MNKKITDKINNIILNYNSNCKNLEKISSKEIFDLIKFYENDYSDILVKSTNKFSEYLEELDFVLVLFTEIYKAWVEVLKSEDLDYALELILILKLGLGDYIAIRNLYACNLESQANSMTRDLLEKYRLFFLINYDKVFAEQFIENKKQLNSSENYHKYLKTSKIKKQLEKINKESNIALDILTSKKTEETYGFLSKFTHTNDIKHIKSYFLKINKYDISNTCFSSDYTICRISYHIEVNIYILLGLIQILNNKYENKINLEIQHILLSYIEVLMLERYKIKPSQ